MPSFHEVRLPTDIEYGFMGGETYSTDIITLFSGVEQRNSNWSQPRKEYTSSYSVKDQAQIDTLIAFFRARKGRAFGFRFRDWTDFQAFGQLIATGDGNSTVYQLIKTYVNGDFDDTQIISKPVAPGGQISTTMIIYLNGVPLVENTDFTVDYTTGQVTMTVPPAVGVTITADFEYDIPVRFDTDSMARMNSYGKEYSWENIKLIEVRV